MSQRIIRPLPPPVVRPRRADFPLRPLDEIDPATLAAMMSAARGGGDAPIGGPSFDPSIMALPPPDMAGAAPPAESLPQPPPAPLAALPAPPSRLSGLRASRDARLREESTPNSRLASGGSMLARGLQAGAPGGLAATLGGGLGGLIAGLINPGADERWRRQEDVGQIDQELQREYALEKASADLADQEQNRKYKEQQGKFLELKPGIEADKIAQRRAENESLTDYRNRTIGVRQDANESIDEYRDRMVDLKSRGLDQGDVKLGQTDRRLDQGDRGLDERERSNRVRESDRDEDRSLRASLGQQGIQIRQVGNRITLEGINANNARAVQTSITQRVNNLRSNARQERNSKFGDPNEATRMEREADDLENELIRKAPAPLQLGDAPAGALPPPSAATPAFARGRTPPAAAPRRVAVPEDRIRAEATRAGLNPDEAVRRARARGILQ